MIYGVTTDESVVRAMAQAIVAEAHPGYHGQTYAFVDIDSWEIYHAQVNRAWNPWGDDALIIAVDDCFDLDGINADASVDWREEAGNLPSFNEILYCYCEAENAREDNGDLADWVDFSEVVAWAEEQSDEWADEIQAYEDASHEAAIDLVVSCVKEFVEVDDDAI